VDDEEELAEGLFVKRPKLPKCPDVKKRMLSKMNPPSIHNTKVRDQYAESLSLPEDIQRWQEVGRGKLFNSLITHTLDVIFFTLVIL
jgi:hypothetical protein